MYIMIKGTHRGYNQPVPLRDFLTRYIRVLEFFILHIGRNIYYSVTYMQYLCDYRAQSSLPILIYHLTK